MDFDDPVEDQPVVRQENFNDHQPIYFQVYLMKDSYFVWIGSNPASFATLNVAAMTPYDSSPQVSTIHGSNTEGAGRSIAARLAKRTGKPVFVSFSPERVVPMLEEWAEKRVVNRLLPTN